MPRHESEIEMKKQGELLLIPPEIQVVLNAQKRIRELEDELNLSQLEVDRLWNRCLSHGINPDPRG